MSPFPFLLITILDMIDPADIQELLDKDPYEPFRIRMTDGLMYDVVDASLAVAMESNMFLALPKGRWKLLSYANMTSVENISEGRSARKNRRSA
jgi:hypothetical protein